MHCLSLYLRLPGFQISNFRVFTCCVEREKLRKSENKYIHKSDRIEKLMGWGWVWISRMDGMGWRCLCLFDWTRLNLELIALHCRMGLVGLNGWVVIVYCLVPWETCYMYLRESKDWTIRCSFTFSLTPQFSCRAWNVRLAILRSLFIQ